MPSVKSHCNGILENIEVSAHRQPLSVVLELANLLCSKPDNDNKIVIKETLVKITTVLDDTLLNTLWETTNTRLQDNALQKAMIKLKQVMLSMPEYFMHIDSDLLIKQSQNLECYRYALIALVRKATKINHGNDDVFENFDFSSVNALGAEKDEGNIQALFAQSDMPIEQIIALGENADIARLILFDLASHNKIFELEAAFARQHPELRAQIAARWTSHFQQFPLSEEQTESVQQLLASLRHFPEFSTININRTSRIFERISGVTSLFYSLADYAKQFLTTVVDLNDATANDCVEFLSETGRTFLPSIPLNRPPAKLDEPEEEVRLRPRK